MTMTRAIALDRSVSTRARLIAPAALAAALLTGPARFTARAQDSADAEELLAGAAAAMAALDSFAFHLTTLNGSTSFIEGITLESVEGAVQRPDRFTATARVDLMLATITLTIVGADGRLWFTNPFGDGTEYEEIDFGRFDELDPAVLINPDRLILPALETLSDPVIAGEATLEDGTMTTQVDGVVDLRRAAGLTGTPVADDDSDLFSLPEDVPFSVWIDGDLLVRRVELTGRILPVEPSGIVRRIDFFDFNEPVDIQPPA